ncbi:hypothetical protein P4T23_15305 [Bacillus spizizenii]|uniref:hypothetical protein n=1 Tax=Bacillus spizizenii TaxID=96241 RepID=UPI0006A87DCB|nr:hypothetical protein [Bacillus spizizenii]MED1072967.1 hypothetical protein [Bacillus spizizenii]CUB30825.1 hypothetical protein BN2127_JRS1_09331 [Bacillus cereus]
MSKYAVEVWAGKEYVGKMLDSNGNVAEFQYRDAAGVAALNFKKDSSLRIWCEVVELK